MPKIDKILDGAPMFVQYFIARVFVIINSRYLATSLSQPGAAFIYADGAATQSYTARTSKCRLYVPILKDESRVRGAL